MREQVLLLLSIPIVFTVAVANAQTPEGTLLFNDLHDTIAIDGETVLSSASTYEAWILLPEGLAGNGLVFNEWTGFQEDKQLSAGPSLVSGYNHPAGGLTSNAEISTGAWHHVAFVHDGAQGQQRLYFDGTLVGSQSIGAAIGNGDGSGYIGAIPRDGTIVDAFRGLLDSVRLSGTARYSGESFTPPPRDMPPDADALLVYHFAKQDFFEDSGVVRVTDRSGNARHGTIGAAFGGASAPAAPARQGDADCSGALNATDALKLLRAAVGSPVDQQEPCPDPGERLTTGLFGDVDCSSDLTATDALKVLSVAVGREATQAQGCVAFMDPV